MPQPPHHARAPGPALRAYLALTAVLQPFMPRHLRKRLKRGKEHPDRWQEKLGRATVARPQGRLIWVHAVGLGEALALRGLIALLSRRTDVAILVTSSTRASGEVLSRDLPDTAVHQYVPLDIPGARRRFLDHWRPDLAIWSEQDLWPGLVHAADQRGIPLALINARMNADAFARRARFRRVYADILARFSIISAQDGKTAEHLTALGAADVRLDGSLKPIAPPLAVDAVALTEAQQATEGRFVWVVGSSHDTDEPLALDAHRLLLAQDPGALLILAPRRPDRRAEIVQAVAEADLSLTCRSDGDAPTGQVYLADTLGEMGVWYSLASVAYVGGTNGPVEGHNPWEPLALGTPVLHGPRTANFANDYEALTQARAAQLADTPEAILAALHPDLLAQLAARGQALRHSRMDQMDGLCQSLLDLLADT